MVQGFLPQMQPIPCLQTIAYHEGEHELLHLVYPKESYEPWGGAPSPEATRELASILWAGLRTLAGRRDACTDGVRVRGGLLAR